MQWLLNSQEANTRLVPVGVTASSSMARNHLSAYLQEACFWAAQKTYQRFKLLQYKYSIEEYFQIANSGVNPPEKIFKSFDFEYSHTNIEGYAKTAIFRFINNTIYRHDLEAKRVKFSDYGLLKDLSHKELREALISKGITQAKSDTYYLVWQCFDEIYQPNQSQGSRSLEPPSQKHLKQIADYYNQRLNKIEISAVPASEEKIKEMLETCIQAARDYRTKRFIPLDNSDYMSDSTPTLWDTAIQEEEREQVQSLIARLFEEIPETGQILLKLSQGLNLTQIEIANVLKNKFPELQKQYQVARQLGKYNNTFLKNFINEWNKIDPEIRLSDERDIERIKNSLSECLQSHCQKMFYTTLDRTVKQYAHEKKNLVSRDGAKLNEETIPQMLQLAVGEIYSRPAEVKQYLATVFRQELKNSMSIATDSLQLVSHKIVVFVDEWLQKSSININEYGKEYGT
ncbi:MAG: sigma-70 family RNA polymerase sigma factor [Scytonema sp. RU_4_4]|nr:sigma-70 family RNA polymerase sigma factor [Scytonema sp. RU_4_4]